MVYLLGTGSGAPYEPVAMMSGLEGGTPVADETTAEQPAAEDGSWTCTCGQANNGNFCSACGTARPAEELKCSKCGHVPEAGTTPKFCSECGNAF